MKVRQNLYIDSYLSDALDGLVIRRGGNKSPIVNEALRDWLARRASKQVDDPLKVRPERLPREVEAGRCDMVWVLEAEVLVVRYHLTVTRPPTDTDAAAASTAHRHARRYIS